MVTKLFSFFLAFFCITSPFSGLLAEEQSVPQTQEGLEQSATTPLPTSSPPKAPLTTSPSASLDEHNSFTELPEEDGGRFMKEFTHMLTVLAIMVGALFFAAWLLKKLVNSRMNQNNTLSQIKIIERRGLTAKTAVFLLEIDGRRVVVSESHNGATLLFQYPLSGASTSTTDQVPSSSEETHFEKLLRKP